MLSESLFEHLDNQNLLPKEQKGCGKDRGKHELIFSDKTVPNEVNTRNKNLTR